MKNNRLFNAFRYAINGVVDVFLNCRNMQIHLLAGISAIVISYLLKISGIEWCLILCCIFMVVAAEMMNCAIEYTVDLVTREQHELAKKAKDAAAGAVLVLAILSLLIAAFIFIPKILLLLE